MRLLPPPKGPCDLCYARDGKSLISVGFDTNIVLVEIPASGNALMKLVTIAEDVHDEAIVSVAVSHSGSHILTGSDDKQLRLLSYPAGGLEHVLTRFSLPIKHVAFSHDDKFA